MTDNALRCQVLVSGFSLCRARHQAPTGLTWLKNLSCCSSNTKMPDHWDITWKRTTAGLVPTFGSMTAHSGTREKKFVGPSESFCKSGNTLPANVLSSEFCKIFNFFNQTSLLIKSVAWKLSCASNTFGTLILYRVWTFFSLFSSSDSRNRVLLSGVAGKLLLQKKIKDELSNWTVFYPMCTDGQQCFKNPVHLVSSKLTERQVLSFQELRLFSYRLFREILTFILSMISFAAVTAAVATDSKNLFTRSSGKMNLASKAAVSNSTTKEIITQRFMFRLVSAIESGRGNIRNEKETMMI